MDVLLGATGIALTEAEGFPGVRPPLSVGTHMITHRSLQQFVDSRVRSALGHSVPSSRTSFLWISFVAFPVILTLLLRVFVSHVVSPDRKIKKPPPPVRPRDGGTVEDCLGTTG